MTVPFQRMLVYIDGSEGSTAALMYAILLAQGTGAELEAIYVVNTKAVSELVKAHIFIDSERTEYLEDLEEDADRQLRHAVKLARSKGVTLVPVKKSGSTPHEVFTCVKDDKIDLLLLCGLTEIRSRRDELISDVDRIIRLVSCPVLLIHDIDDVWMKFEQDVM
ncbi:universal stress protein [Parasphaerochaeta coccoides]|uniref:UspA domain-containing protein n=1 Tax=Parasphaerochaeta coccoides (strain ATCC BAA-1237 / DSM 17374 / SPN1) TaxID=760011 RepID=F4GLK9_PARC1|nr:universal stress protein [Parasphaerochaeta coccoides]AEC01979.1 UspA domain-containing protein [Parasphaerochaeta coccoides DSM 17374]